MIYIARSQIFGKDSFLTLGQETVSSREQWAASVDDPVSSAAPTGLLGRGSFLPRCRSFLYVTCAMHGRWDAIAVVAALGADIARGLRAREPR